ncbi:MAG: M16 family metallopeptidase [Pseudomonadota bacterium]
MRHATGRPAAFARLTAALALLALSLAAPQSPARAATEVEVVTSPGGVTAWLVREPSIPMLAIEMIFEGGTSREPAEKAGAMNFLAAMLDEGAGELDSAAFSARADELALRTGFEAGRDGFTVSARILTENREKSVELLRSALTEPRFDAEAMERVRAGILSGIRSARTDADDLASQTWRAALFPDDPYGRPIEGSEESVAALSAGDLEAMRRIALNRADVAVGVVGDITAEELAPLLDRLFGDLPDAPLPELSKVEMTPARALEVVELDVPQSVARLIHEGPARHDPDFIPAYVMNHILGGGGFSSRLTEEVREKRGLTYSVFSFLAPQDRAPIMGAGVSSDNARVAEAVSVIREEWARMREEGATAQELEDAKRYLTGAYPLRFDSNAGIAGQLAGLMSEGFEPDYIRKRNDLIEAVTLEDVSRVAERFLHPDRLKVVVVGQPERLPPED